MWRKWLNLIETGLLVILAGFIFLPNAFLPLILVALLLLRAIAEPRNVIPSKQSMFLMIPAFITALSWALGGFESAGRTEVELWGIAFGVFIYLQHRSDNKLHIFQQSFIVWSFLQALLLLTFLALTDPFGSFGFSQQVRDAIQNQFQIHPTYITAAWCWALLLFWIRSKLKPSHKIWLSVLFLFMIAITGGKMPLIALAICAIICVIRQITLPLKYRLALLGVIPILVMLIASTPVMQDRFSEIASLDMTYSEGQMLSSSELRVGIWKCSIESILESPWFGAGIGNTRLILENCFEHYQQVEFFEGEYNSHNQFMHYWLAGGVLGVLILSIFFGYLLWTSLKSKNEILLYFLIYFLIISLTENYFSRQLGIMMWAFFIAGWTQKQCPLRS